MYLKLILPNPILSTIYLFLILTLSIDHDDGSLSAEQNLRWHIAHGYNAAIITGHNTLDSGTYFLFLIFLF